MIKFDNVLHSTLTLKKIERPPSPIANRRSSARIRNSQVALEHKRKLQEAALLAAEATVTVKAKRKRKMTSSKALVDTEPKSTWYREKVENAPTVLKKWVEQYLYEGYVVVKNVLLPKDVNLLVEGPIDTVIDASDTYFSNDGRPMRMRKGNQLWKGARKSIQAHIKIKGGTETVLSPLTTRESGRYDMPLPLEVAKLVMARLQEHRVMDLSKYLVKAGKVRTQDIMLSMPGSVEQQAHTDSSWSGKASRDPRTHYLTILIPLSLQDKETGGTRIWPKSHRRGDVTDWSHPLEMIEPHLFAGDALIFDGLLSHQGMANLSKDKLRYFYYAAFASGHDPNTDVTGS